MNQREKQEQFIQKANQKHNNKYNYSKVNYVNAHTNVEIICDKDGSFFQTPSNHLKKGCKQCGIRNSQLLRKQPLDEFIRQAKEKHGDKYNYELVVYKNKKSKIKIICNECNQVFEQQAETHKRGANCPTCTNKKSGQMQKIIFEEFKRRVNILYNNKYDYSLAKFDDLNSDIEIICKQHKKIFTQKALYHCRGTGCKECADEQRKETVKKTQVNKLQNIMVIDDVQPKQTKTEKFIEKVKKIHGDKYNYSVTNYVNCHTNVKIECKKHGIFEQTPSNHFHSDCPKCAKENADAKYRFTTEQFIQKAIEIHKDKYDYSKVNYINYGTNVEIICKKPTHGSFFQTPSNHLSTKRGCIKCRDELIGNNQRDTLEDFIEKANKIHNNKYDYSKVIYVNSNTKIEIVCGDHSFFQTPKSHMQNTGCPKCIKKSFSMKAITWLEYVAKKDNITIQHAMNTGEYKLPNTNLKVDGFCEKSKTIYEFWGCLYHGCLKCNDSLKINPVNKRTFGDLYIKTLERIVLIQGMEYNLITIWEHEWDQISKNLLKTK